MRPSGRGVELTLSAQNELLSGTYTFLGESIDEVRVG